MSTVTKRSILMATSGLITVLVTGCGGAAGDLAGAATPAASIEAAATVLDGTYRWTQTAQDATEYGTPNDRTPEALATFPWLFTLALAADTWSLVVRDDTGQMDTDSGTFAVTGDRLVFTWPVQNSVLTFAFIVADDGSLTVQPVGPMDAGDRFVWTTNPWQKIG